MQALEKQILLNKKDFFADLQHPSNQSRAKRILDITGAMIGLTLTVVLLPIIAIAIYLESPGPILVAQPKLGQQGRQFKLWKFRTTVNVGYYRLKIKSQKEYRLQKDELRFTRVGKVLRKFYLDELPQFLNVLKGEMSLVGMRPSSLEEAQFYSKDDWQRLAAKPGMTGIWKIRKNKFSMSADEILQEDLAYLANWKVSLDIQILLATLIHLVFGSTSFRLADPNSREANFVNILNCPIDNLSFQELLDKLESGIVVTPNVDHLMKLQKDPEFYEICLNAEYKVCDSQILIYASRFLGTPLKERISGSDLFPAFCEHHRHNSDVKIFLLGGMAGVADEARTKINQRIGREIVVASHSPSFGFEKNEQECLEIVEMINQSQATVLAVGVGAPKQEKWICKYRKHLTHVKIFLAVGATIDFEAGKVKRAPKWISDMGMEWLYRVGCEPKRLWKRYLVEDIPFFWLLLKQKLGLYNPPFTKSQTLKIS